MVVDVSRVVIAARTEKEEHLRVERARQTDVDLVGVMVHTHGERWERFVTDTWCEPRNAHGHEP